MQLVLRFMAFLCTIANLKITHTLGDSLRVAYEWREIDFLFDSIGDRIAAIQNRLYIPQNIIPFGLEVYRERVFLTLPRWKNGLPATLAYFDINENSTKSPMLKPYPSWAAHNIANEFDAEIVSPFRVRADRCGRLWVLDSRIAGILEHTKLYGSAQLLVYDLRNDNLIRRHVFPADQMKKNSFFANLVVEDGDCSKTFAYAADLGNPGLVVYSWNEQSSWRVQHNYFHPDPLAGNFSINNISFQWDDGLYGLALSQGRSHNLLYFHALSSNMEFVVDTSILHNKTEATSGQIYNKFKILGSRGVNGQAGASIFDKNTDIILYALPNLNAVGCWQTANSIYSLKDENIITKPVELSFPSDLTIDEKEQLWILSNNLHEFLYGELNSTTSNFRLLVAPLRDVIQKTTCGLKTRTFKNNSNDMNRAQSGTQALQKPGIVFTILAFSCIIYKFFL